MAQSAIVFSWGSNVAGREAMALTVFMSALQYFGDLKQKGQLEDVRVYIADAGNFGRDAGQMVVEGTTAQVTAMVAREDYQRVVLKAAHVCQEFRVLPSVTGDQVMKKIEQLVAVRKELGIS